MTKKMVSIVILLLLTTAMNVCAMESGNDLNIVDSEVMQRSMKLHAKDNEIQETVSMTTGRSFEEVLEDVSKLHNFVADADVLYSYYCCWKSKNTYDFSSFECVEIFKLIVQSVYHEYKESYEETLKRLTLIDDLPRVERLVIEMIAHNNKDDIFSDNIDLINRYLKQLGSIEKPEEISALFEKKKKEYDACFFKLAETERPQSSERKEQTKTD